MGHNSAEYIHTSAEALKLAFADREKFLGDIDFINIPFEDCSQKNMRRTGEIDRSESRIIRDAPRESAENS